MRRPTQIELFDKAHKLLSDNPKADKVFATSDGNVFLDESRAKHYANSAKLKLQTFEKKKTVKPIISKDGNS